MQRKTGMDTFYGKYRARVIRVFDDSENRGRIQVECPRVYGDSESPWCNPLWGYCFDRHGDFVMPEIGDYVYIEFEEGNPNYPIWVGAWVSKNETPLVNESAYNQTSTPHEKAQSLVESAGGLDEVYEEHHDTTRIIQFGKFWIIMHRNEDWLKIYMTDPEQELTEFFTDENKLWLKRKKGKMVFYSDDNETYLERNNSVLKMTDDSTVLSKGDNTITMTDKNTVFDIPNDLIYNVGNNIISNAGGIISDSATTIRHN